jgi:glucokinase
MKIDAELGLVGDIGGTNARFAWIDLHYPGSGPQAALDLRAREHATVQHAIGAYLEQAAVGRRPAHVVLAVAGPVENGAIRFTNMNWCFSEADLLAAGFSSARLINDFAALAHAAANLSEDATRSIGGPATGPRDQSIAVLGAGTGFGVSALARDGRSEAVLATEGGHVGFAPTDDVEIEILRRLGARFGRVSVERILSGPGLCNLHRALCEIDGQPDVVDDPAEITRRALEGDEPARRTVERFCAIFGSVAGDFALALGARGGAFIAGGIAAGIVDELERSAFRSRFEDKGRFKTYMQAIPTRVIVRPHAALAGAAQVLPRFTL